MWTRTQCKNTFLEGAGDKHETGFQGGVILQTGKYSMFPGLLDTALYLSWAVPSTICFSVTLLFSFGNVFFCPVSRRDTIKLLNSLFLIVSRKKNVFLWCFHFSFCSDELLQSAFSVSNAVISWRSRHLDFCKTAKRTKVTVEMVADLRRICDGYCNIKLFNTCIHSGPPRDVL